MEALTYQEAEQMVEPGRAMSWVTANGVKMTTIHPWLRPPITVIALNVEVEQDFSQSYKVRFFI